MLKAVAYWASLAALLVAIATALHAVFPAVRGHIAMGVAAALLLSVRYVIRNDGAGGF